MTRTLAIEIHRWARACLHRDEMRGFTLGWLTVVGFRGSLVERLAALKSRLVALRARMGGTC